MVVAALDISSKTGVCVLDTVTNQILFLDEFRLGVPLDIKNMHHFYLLYLKAVGIFEKFIPDKVVIETPVGWASSRVYLSYLHGCIYTAIGYVASKENKIIELEWVYPKSLKKNFTGKGDASKAEMIKEFNRKVTEYTYIDDSIANNLLTDNMADAFALALYFNQCHYNNETNKGKRLTRKTKKQ